MTVPLRAGAYVLGVRANSAELGELLRARFADRLVPEADPPGNLSVWLAPPADDGPQELHRLYETYTRTLRSRCVSRILDGVWHDLDARDQRLEGDTLLADVTVLVRDGRAHLVAPRWRRTLADVERTWQRDGFALVERRWVELDLADGTVTVPPSGLNLSDDEVAGLPVDHRPAPPSPTGRFPIASWTGARGEATPAGRLVAAAACLLDRPRHGGAVLIQQLRALLERVPPTDPGWSSFDDLRDRLLAR